jgi:hypothetical protein
VRNANITPLWQNVGRWYHSLDPQSTGLCGLMGVMTGGGDRPSTAVPSAATGQGGSSW